MALKYALKDKYTGQVFEDKTFMFGLAGGKFFSSLDRLDAMFQSEQGEEGHWPWVVIDSLEQELPHFFSDKPMFILRHRSGTLWGKWYDAPGKCRPRLATFPERYWPGNEDTLRPELWEVIDHRRRVVRSGMQYDFHVPEEAGLLAVGRKVGPYEYVYCKTKGTVKMKPWFTNLNVLKQWVSGNGRCLFVEKYRNQVTVKQAKGLYLIRSLGNGEFERLKDVDLFC